MYFLFLFFVFCCFTDTWLTANDGDILIHCIDDYCRCTSAILSYIMKLKQLNIEQGMQLLRKAKEDVRYEDYTIYIIHSIFHMLRNWLFVYRAS